MNEWVRPAPNWLEHEAIHLAPMLQMAAAMRYLPVLCLVACSSTGGNAGDPVDASAGADMLTMTDAPGGDAPGGDAPSFPDAGPPKNVDFEWTAGPVPPSDPPATSYQVSGGVVLDTATGLQWQRESSQAMTWAFAVAHCTQLGTGWRLPTLVELTSLVDYGASLPAIDAAAFPNTPLQQFWTSTQAHAIAGYRWAVYFRWGDSSHRGESEVAHARCVRSPNTPVTGTAGAPAGRYAVTADTVTDTVTGLRWQRTVPTTTMSRAEATTYCADLSLAGSTAWRVPQVKELQSLVDVRHTNPTIDPSLPTTSSFYFTATPYSYDTAKPWSVSFSSGTTYPAGATMPAYVRCVE